MSLFAVCRAYDSPDGEFASILFIFMTYEEAYTYVRMNRRLDYTGMADVEVVEITVYNKIDNIDELYHNKIEYDNLCKTYKATKKALVASKSVDTDLTLCKELCNLATQKANILSTSKAMLVPSQVALDKGFYILQCNSPKKEDEVELMPHHVAFTDKACARKYYGLITNRMVRKYTIANLYEKILDLVGRHQTAIKANLLYFCQKETKYPSDKFMRILISNSDIDKYALRINMVLDVIKADDINIRALDLPLEFWTHFVENF